MGVFLRFDGWRARCASPRRTGAILFSSLILAMAWSAPSTEAASLRGSESSIRHQYQVSREHQFTAVKNSKQLREFVAQGYFVPVDGNAYYELGPVSYPYARPAVRTFIERLAEEYFYATGEKLVVTSLSRPLSKQPRNASRYSVHPTGMAVDIRRTNAPAARRWIERRLLQLEAEGVIDATHERRPPHYHVAVFPNPYEQYLAAHGVAPAKGPGAVAADLMGVGEAAAAEPAGLARPRDNQPEYVSYKVRQGDSLWDIAQRHRTTVTRIRQLNGMRSSRIFPGQTLMVPELAR